MKKIVIDLDSTLTIECDASYQDKSPNLEVIQQLRSYSKEGFYIIIHTARNMRTYGGNIGKINAFTVPIIIEWLKKHNVPYDEIVVGKPWCGTEGFYVDDKSIRPSEFAKLSYSEIQLLLSNEQSGKNPEE